MQSLTFVFEATLLAPLVEFATSTSGHVEPRQGLALGWLGSVVAGLAVVFGTADRAQADYCGGIPEGEGYKKKYGWICFKDEPCETDHKGNPIKWYTQYHSHAEIGGCKPIGPKICTSC